MNLHRVKGLQIPKISNSHEEIVDLLILDRRTIHCIELYRALYPMLYVTVYLIKVVVISKEYRTYSNRNNADCLEY
jgi:hypothetical protein